MFEPPARAYLVCATPRSGSTLLCEMLKATDVAGRPEEYFEILRATGRPRQPREFFPGAAHAELRARLTPTVVEPPEGTDAFLERVRQAIRDGTTPNGVFASKLMWWHLLDLGARLKAVPGFAGLRTADALRRLFGEDLRYVHVIRRDTVAQAVSLWKAIQTQQWRDAGEPDTAPAVYDRDAIGHLADGLTAEHEAWSSWFSGLGIRPTRVVYEELVLDPRGTIRRVLDELRIAGAADVALEHAGMRRQSDGVSQDWAERFRAEQEVAV